MHAADDERHADHAPPDERASPEIVLGSSYSSPTLSFEYPSEWTAMNFEGLFTPFASPLVFVSNQLMEDPCKHESVCRPWPVSVLEPGGVVLKWSSNGFPDWRFADQQGRAMTVGGHAARLVHRDVCGRSFGADRSLAIIVRRAASNNWYELDACFRDPDKGGTYKP